MWTPSLQPNDMLVRTSGRSHVRTIFAPTVVFDAIISAFLRLNSVGYVKEVSGIELYLVCNQTGPSLSQASHTLEGYYKCQLKRAFDIYSTKLICITNKPNDGTVDGVMCGHQVHVARDGSLYACDFNYALDIGIPSFPKLHGVLRSYATTDLQAVRIGG